MEVKKTESNRQLLYSVSSSDTEVEFALLSGDPVLLQC